MFVRVALAVVGIFFGFAPSARCGVILDGVPDSQYLAWAGQPQFQASGRLGSGSGTLIASNWVLTAAHVGIGNFTIGGNTYTAAQFIPHPQFTLNGGDINYGYDIALVRLTTNVVGITPASVYTGSNEVGSLATLSGYGATGVGSSANPTGGGTYRAGTNVVDVVYSFSDGPNGKIGAKNALLVTDFDAPAGIGTAGQYNTTGSATPTSLEYHLASGDSGGGMFLQENGKWFLAGVNSGVDSQRGWDGTNNASLNNQLFGYGAISAMTRVSSYQSFIGQFTAVPEPSSMLCASIGIISLGALTRLRRSRAQIKK